MELEPVRMDTTILPYPADTELPKWFPLPDIQTRCPNCENLVILSGITIDYPKMDCGEMISGRCSECTFRITVEVVIEVRVRPTETS